MKALISMVSGQSMVGRQRIARLAVHGFFITTLLASAAPADIVIDDFVNFDAGLWPLVANSGVPSASNFQSGLTGVVGGIREASAEWTSGTNDVTASMSAGTYSLAAGGATDGQGRLTYRDGSGGLNADLTLGEDIVVNVASGDLGSTAITVLLQDNLGASASSTQIVGALGELSFPLTDFGVGLNLSEIDFVEVTIDPFAGTQISLDSITANLIPEPTSLVLLGLVGLWLPFRRRRV